MSLLSFLLAKHLIFCKKKISEKLKLDNYLIYGLHRLMLACLCQDLALIIARLKESLPLASTPT
jgi:hypothetical protein